MKIGIVDDSFALVISNIQLKLSKSSAKSQLFMKLENGFRMHF